jgi:hypothetical protein
MPGDDLDPADAPVARNPVDLADALGLVGLALVCGGAWMIYPPSALIIAGAALVCVALGRARAG